MAVVLEVGGARCSSVTGHEPVVTARDRAGNEAAPVRLGVTCDQTPPRVELLEPARALIGTSPFTVRGLVDDPDVKQVAVSANSGSPQTFPVSNGQYGPAVSGRWPLRVGGGGD